MNFKTKLCLSSFLSIGLIIVLLVVVLASVAKLEREKKEWADSWKTLHLANGLDRTAHAYLLSHTDQTGEEWREKYIALGQATAVLKNEGGDSIEKKIISLISENYSLVGVSFEKLNTNIAREQGLIQSGASKAELNTLLSERNAIVADQFSRLQSISNEASLLSENNIDDMLLIVHSGKNAVLSLVLLMFFCGLLAVFFVSLVILRFLKTLTSGTEAVSRGDFHYKIPVESEDELGAAAAAFNKMTGDLLSITASKSELEKEIRDREEAERKLKEIENNMKVIVSNTPDHLIMQDKDLKYTFVINPQLGLREHEMIGKTDFDFFSIKDAVWLTKVKQSVMETGKPHALTVPLSLLGEEQQYFEGSYVPMHDQDGKPAGIIGYFKNITARKKFETALEKAMSELKSAEETIRKDKILLDEAGKIAKLGAWELSVETMKKVWTDEMYKIHGVDRENFDPNDRHDAEFFSPESKRLLEKVMEDAITAGTPYDIELEFTTPDGVQKVARAIGRAEKENGAVKRVYGVVQDITEMKRTSDRVKNFISILAHEMRNPLAPILSEIELLKIRDGSVSGDELKEALAVIERQTSTLTMLLKDLMDVSRLEKGKITLSTGMVDLSSVITKAIETTKPLLSRAKQNVDVVFPHRAMIVNGDAMRLEQVFSNLLSNASKYSGENSPIKIRLAKKAGKAVVSVKDQGVGIPKLFIKDIFELFAQNEEMSRLKGGLGIGLHLSRSLVRLHGGTIEAKSAGVGKGSEFIVVLPLAE